MPRKSRKGRCISCKSWEKGRCYPDQADWGLCGNENLNKELSIGCQKLGTYQGFGCIHYDERIFVTM
jgi:hypothetical protein